MSKGGEFIRLCRWYRGYTQQTLAKLTGLHYETIRKAECGVTDPTFSTLEKCLKACGFRIRIEVDE